MKAAQRKTTDQPPTWTHVVKTTVACVQIECTPTGVSQVRFLSNGSQELELPHRPAESDEPAWVEQVRTQVRRYLEGCKVDFSTIPIDLNGQPQFRRAVLCACRMVGYGQTVTYAELARRIGRRNAARAVGSSMSRNPLPIIIPCHRVVQSGGGLGGFSAPGGVQIKQLLLTMERAALERRSCRNGSAIERQVTSF
jgi:O-6-methylguanine DNA methyltransferase